MDALIRQQHDHKLGLTMTAVEEADAGKEAENSDEKSKTPVGDGAYYNDWERYAKAEAKAAEEEEKAAKQERERQQMLANLPKQGSHLGYEFRKGSKVQFPDIPLLGEEGDDEAAWRVACERKEAGNQSFRDGTVWGAQMAIDAWAQALLCLTRIRNLRKGRMKKASDDVKKALADAAALARGEQPEQEKEVDFMSAETWEAMGWGGEPKPKPETAQDMSKETVAAIGKAIADCKAAQKGPTDADVEGMVCTLQMNLAQGLLKLGQCEAAVGHCDTAIAIDPTNVKALWRKAKAVWGTRNPGLARAALDALRKVDPDNPAAISMLQEIEIEEARRRKKRTGVTIKPTFRFPNSKKSSAPQTAVGAEEILAAFEDDEEEHEQEEEEEENEENEEEQEASAALLEQIDSKMIPALSGWFCCRRKRKSD